MNNKITNLPKIEINKYYIDKWNNIILITNIVFDDAGKYYVYEVVVTGYEDTLTVGEFREFGHGSFRHKTLIEIGTNSGAVKLLYGK